MVIGIIDSGRGGLAVAKQLENNSDQIILLMDQAFFPYGQKSKIVLCARAFQLVQYLISKKVDLIVIACNTLSIVALPFLKMNINFPIVGVFEYLIPYLKPNNLLIGSKITVEYVSKHYSVKTVDATDFIQAIEKGRRLDGYIERLTHIKFDQLILGCTHFLVLPKIKFKSPTINQLDFLKRDIEKYRKVLEKTKTNHLL